MITYYNMPRKTQNKLLSVRTEERVYNAAQARYSRKVGKTKGTMSNLINIVLKAYTQGALDKALDTFIVNAQTNKQISIDDIGGS